MVAGVVAVVFALAAESNLAAQTMMGGKIVRHYDGRVNMLNERTGRIIVDVEDGSVGHWRVGGYTVVLRGDRRLSLHAVLDSLKVRVWVAEDGTIQRIAILEIRRG